MDQPQKILCIKLRAIGDTVIWTSALQTLRDRFPKAEIHVLTYAGNAAVLKEHTAVDKHHYLHSHSHSELLRRLFSFRRENLTWLLGFHATTSLCRWAWLAGAQKTALHHHSWTKSPRGSVIIPSAGKLENAIARDFRVLEAFGVSGPHPETRIHLLPAEREAAESLLSAEISKCGGNPHLPRYLFLPGAGHHLRRYPKEQWLPLAKKMLAEKLYQPVVVVDAALARELALEKDCRQLGLPLMDHGTLREFIAVLSRGQRAFANDSGPGHIAVAVGVKTSFVFGPGCVGDWHPYDQREHPIFRIAVPCRSEGPRDQETFQFCTVNECSHHRCMRDLVVKGLG